MARILLAEDDRTTAELLAAVLEEMGHRVDVASGGWAALALAARYAYDLLVTDATMPGLDGPGLIAEFRKLPGRDAVPALVLSALGDAGIDEVRRRVEGLPSVGVARKPGGLEAVRAELRKVLGGNPPCGS